jgi:hypothetical protein
MTIFDDISRHYTESWGSLPESDQWLSGPYSDIANGFRALIFPPTAKRNVWTYATCGMSISRDATPLELHIFSPYKDRQLVEILTVIAHYHQTAHSLDIWHTVNFGRPWLDHSPCDYGLLSLPYLDGPSLEWLEVGDQKKIRFLWLIPITSSELEYKKRHGIEALESLFEEKQFNYANPKRPAVV